VVTLGLVKKKCPEKSYFFHAIKTLTEKELDGQIKLF
jgi:hypothetical protein